jgi:hypothetical protein
MKNKIKKHKAITLEYGVIGNVEEYIDVDIYVDLPTGEQYLARVYKELGKHGIIGPTYRYAESPIHDFSHEDATPPLEVHQAMDSIMGDIASMIYEEDGIRESRIQEVLI